MPSTIAFFDFDGTITTKDTMLELIKFHKGKLLFWVGLVCISPWLAGMRLKLISNKTAKEKLLTFFWRGLTTEEFAAIGAQFVHQRLSSLIRPKALAAIHSYQNRNIPVVIISASSDIWVKPWCDLNHIRFIGTRLQVINNIITGKIEGNNCNNEEKPKRIKELYDLATFQEIHCYGDTKGDNAMLAIATQAFYKHF